MTAVHRTATEGALSVLWAEILQRPPGIGEADDFFELGGDSVMMMVMMIRVSRKFGVELSPEQLFEYPTLGALATLIDESLNRGADAFQAGRTDCI